MENFSILLRNERSELLMTEQNRKNSFLRRNVAGGEKLGEGNEVTQEGSPSLCSLLILLQFIAGSARSCDSLGASPAASFLTVMLSCDGTFSCSL